MGVASHVFPRLEAAPQNRMDADGVKIIGGYNASDGALGAIAEAESGAHDFGDDEGVDQRAVLLQIKEVGPRDISVPRLAASGSGDGEQPFLVSNQRVGAEEDSFDPTEDSGIHADPQMEAQNGQDGKARAAAWHAERDAEVLQ